MKHLVPVFLSLLVFTGCQRKTVRVGIMDSGMNPMDVKSDHGWNYVDDNDDTTDTTGHGSMIASIIASYSADCVLVPLKVRQESPDVSDHVIQALYDAVNEYDCDIVCMAFSIPESEKLHEAVRYAYENGVILIGAAGNTGKGSAVLYPSGYQEVISVGALDENGNIADYSAQAEVYVDGIYESFKGTSVSCAKLTGICAEHHFRNSEDFRRWIQQNV